MLIWKHLPSVRDARIYMSVERTYLGYMRFSIYILSFGIFLQKLEMLADITQKIHLSPMLDLVAKASSPMGMLIMLAGLFSFVGGIKCIDGGEEVSAKEVTDPRIYMAAERTFLAWVRTSVALIVFGFVVEKFEFFLYQLERIFNVHLHGDHRGLIGIGVLIIAVGLLTLMVGMLNFHRTIRQVDRGYYRTHLWLYKIYGLVVFVLCLVLSFYLLKII